MLVKDIMTTDVVTVTPTMGIYELAALFVQRNISGVPVVDEKSGFLGIVLEEGLIFHDKKVHLPSFVHIAMGFLTFGMKRFEEEIAKVTAATVSQLMEEQVLSLSPAMTIEDAATLMIDKGMYYCPVLEEGKLLGVITKKDIVRAIAREAGSRS